MRKSKDTELTPIGNILLDLIDPAEAAKARVKAILDEQARKSTLARSIRALSRENKGG